MTHLPDFSIGECYQMYFTIFNSKIQFKILEHLPKGYKRAVICESGHEFNFCSIFLFHDEIESLKKIDCRCKAKKSTYSYKIKSQTN